MVKLTRAAASSLVRPAELSLRTLSAPGNLTRARRRARAKQGLACLLMLSRLWHSTLLSESSNSKQSAPSKAPTALEHAQPPSSSPGQEGVPGPARCSWGRLPSAGLPPRCLHVHVWCWDLLAILHALQVRGTVTLMWKMSPELLANQRSAARRQASYWRTYRQACQHPAGACRAMR